jgi:hypothetical protein
MGGGGSAVAIRRQLGHAATCLLGCFSGGTRAVHYVHAVHHVHAVHAVARTA